MKKSSYFMIGFGVILAVSLFFNAKIYWSQYEQALKQEGLRIVLEQMTNTLDANGEFGYFIVQDGVRKDITVVKKEEKK